MPMNSKYSGVEQFPPENRSVPGMLGGSGTTGNSQFPFDPEQIKKKVRLTMMAVLAAVVLFIGLVGSLVFYPYLFAGFFEIFDPGPIKGNLLALTYVPQNPDNETSAVSGGKVWIVTNPSFNYVQTVSTPGSYSVSSECAGCKIRVYIYDPLNKTVQSQWDIDLKGMPYDVDLYREKDAVWLSARQTDSMDPFIYKYDAKTGAQLLNTGSFVKENPQLTAGIVELSHFENPRRLDLKLADGKEFIFTPADGKFYAGQQEFNQANESGGSTTVFGLTEESSDQRKKLYSITGPRAKVLGGRCDTHAGKADTLKFFCESTAKLLSEEIFLEPIILYQDDRTAVIFHQNSLGRDAQRMLTAYDLEGKKLWTVPQERLFNAIKYDPDNSLSAIFFLQSHLSAELSGGVFVFIMEGVGAVGLDAQQGTELWRIET